MATRKYMTRVTIFLSLEHGRKCNIIIIKKVSSHDKSCSGRWEPKILDGISLGTKRYDKVLKLRHNAVKQFFKLPVHLDF